jgi:hypothetical protein
MANKGLLQLFKKETKKEKEKREEEEKKKEIEENPLVKGDSLDPKHGIKKHSIIVESMATGLEKHYFWVLRFLKEKPNHGLGFEVVEKIRDLFLRVMDERLDYYKDSMKGDETAEIALKSIWTLSIH